MRDLPHELNLEMWKNPGITPGIKQARALAEALAWVDEEGAQLIEKALLRAYASTPDPIDRMVTERIPEAQRPARARLTRLLGRMALAKPLAGQVEQLCVLVRDEDLKTALNAVAALGSLPSSRVEQVLLEQWGRGADLRPEMRRALIRALGKAGGNLARDILLAYEPGAMDREEQRLLGQARLILQRTAVRSETGRLIDRLTVVPDGALILHCRRGLESFVREEWAELLGHHPEGSAPIQQLDQKSFPAPKMRQVQPGRLLLEGRGLASVLEVVPRLRCVERWAFVVGGKAHAYAQKGQIEAALRETLCHPANQDWLERMTIGKVRYRIDWKAATNAQMWALAERLTADAPALVNDPTESLWEIGVLPDGPGKALIEIRAKGHRDGRFAYRDAAVPASSHPPLAAALARLAGVRSDDIVWDPFCGAGTELIERAKLGSYAALWGTDLDPKAITSAKVNLSRAGVDKVSLDQGDARHWQGVRPTLTITNPPLGRRVARGEARDLLRVVTAHIAQQLAPSGRLVWVSPFPDETRRILEAAGLAVTFRATVDMGGFDAEMQRADKPSTPVTG